MTGERGRGGQQLSVNPNMKMLCSITGYYYVNIILLWVGRFSYSKSINEFQCFTGPETGQKHC